MTPEEVAASLLGQGSTEVQEFGDLKVGSRVRHRGHQWPEAWRDGTGNIERIFHNQNSAWEKQYGRPDIELIVRRDNGEYMFVADYHVELTEVAA